MDNKTPIYKMVNSYELVLEELRLLKSIDTRLANIEKLLGGSEDENLSEKCLQILTKTLCGVDVKKVAKKK